MSSGLKVPPEELHALTEELVALWEAGDAMVAVLGRQVAACRQGHLDGSCARCAMATAAILEAENIKGMIQRAKEAAKRGQTTARAVRRRALRRIK